LTVLHLCDGLTRFHTHTLSSSSSHFDSVWINRKQKNLLSLFHCIVFFCCEWIFYLHVIIRNCGHFIISHTMVNFSVRFKLFTPNLNVRFSLYKFLFILTVSFSYYHIHFSL
jgi:hypothetical protein